MSGTRATLVRRTIHHAFPVVGYGPRSPPLVRPLTTARLLASLAFVASAGIPALAQPFTPQPALPIAPTATIAPEIALEILNDGAASDPERQSAADSLVAQSDSLTVRDQLALVLAEPVSGAGGCRYVLAAIDRLPRVSDRLFPALSARIAISPDWELPPSSTPSPASAPATRPAC